MGFSRRGKRQGDYRVTRPASLYLRSRRLRVQTERVTNVRMGSISVRRINQSRRFSCDVFFFAVPCRFYTTTICSFHRNRVSPFTFLPPFVSPARTESSPLDVVNFSVSRVRPSPRLPVPRGAKGLLQLARVARLQRRRRPSFSYVAVRTDEIYFCTPKNQ